jgi:DNA-binding GntR family transcriptional regulator
LARPGRSKTALEEHKKIVEALAERNGKLAEQLAREHIENAEHAMMLSLEKQGLYYKEE